MKPLPKLLITGASGFTGHHACHHFSQRGFDVTAVTRNQPHLSLIKVEHCNLVEKEAVRNLIKKTKPQYLLHLAGQNHVGQSWEDPISTLEVNFLSTINLIEALRLEKPDCKTVIIGSALQYDPSDINTLPHPYSFSKTLQVLASQAWAELYNLHVVIAKPSNLIGPGHSTGVCSIFAKKVAAMEQNKQERILEVNNLNIERDFLDVRDAVKAYEILLYKGVSKEIYDISSANSISLGEITNLLQELTNIKFEVKDKSKDIELEKVRITPVKMKNLGWKPMISIKSSLRDSLNYYRDQLNSPKE